MTTQVNLQHRLNAWQVSFADLLTLLLCFFVALASAGTFNSPAIEVGNSNKKAGIDIAKTSVAGTAVDVLKVNKTILITAKMFEGDNFDLEQKSLLKLKSDINSDGYAVKSIQIATCDSSLNATKAKNWDLSMRRMLGLLRQITDMGVSKSAIVTRLQGPVCLGIKQADTDQQEVAKLFVEYIKKDI